MKKQALDWGWAAPDAPHEDNRPERLSWEGRASRWDLGPQHGAGSLGSFCAQHRPPPLPVHASFLESVTFPPRRSAGWPGLRLVFSPPPQGPPVRVSGQGSVRPPPCAKERDVGLAPPPALADYIHRISGQCPSVQRGSLGVGRAGGRTAVEWQLRGIGPLASDPDVCLRRHLTQKHDGPLSQRASV